MVATRPSIYLASRRKNKLHGFFPWTNGKLRESDQVFFQQIELKTKNSTKRQQSCRLVEFLVFNSAFGRHSNFLIPSTVSSIGDCYVEVITL